MKNEKRVRSMRCIRINLLAHLAWGLVAGAGLLSSVACGSRATDNLGGETGFLETCERDTECQSGLCACGVCTRTCEQTAECDDSRATCASTANGEECAVNAQRVCVSTQDSTEVPSSNATSAERDSGNCRGPGRYEAGKEGSYLPCCDGLKEVAQLSPQYDSAGAPICSDLPLRVYACIEGSCGDAVCEVGEDVACGCVEDCTNALWEPPTPVPTVPEDGGVPHVPCEGFTCEVQLGSVSPGQVEIQVAFSGPFCSDSCGLHLPTVYHVETGLYVPVGRGLDCSDCRELSGTGECAPPEVMGRTWNGSINYSESMCTTDTGNDVACQTEPKYAPAGRYRAQLCALDAINVEGTAQCPDGGELRCESVEFNYPSSEPVVLRFDNIAVEQADAGLHPEVGPSADASIE